MKWKVLRLFLPLLVAGFVIPHFLPGPDGRPIMSLSDWLPEQRKMDAVNRVLDRIPRVAEEGVDAMSAPEKVYKWQDEYGVWHFTNDPRQAPEHALPDTMPEVVNEMPAPEPGLGTGLSDGPGGAVLSGVDNLSELPDDLLEGAEHIRRLAAERNEALEQL